MRQGGIWLKSTVYRIRLGPVSKYKFDEQWAVGSGQQAVGRAESEKTADADGLLPTAHCPLPTAHCLLPPAHRPLPSIIGNVNAKVVRAI